jgi:hypothetical protein
VALIPGVHALLPGYASLHDPVAELRAAVGEAVAWLGDDVRIVASEQGRRVGESALEERGVSTGPTSGGSILVVGNGSACRTEKAPGFLDERAEAFDAALRRALIDDPAALADIDLDLGRELWADVDALPSLAELGLRRPEVRYDDAPYGVQYWVITWES